MSHLERKVVLVTGAGRGFGREIALQSALKRATAGGTRHRRKCGSGS